MEQKCQESLSLLQKLTAAAEGAPYPGSVNEELYAIWYEHMQRVLLDCLEFLHRSAPENGNKVHSVIEAFSRLHQQAQ